MHLGNLSISNKFLYAGDVGTLDHKSGSSQQVPLSSEDPMTQSIYTPQQDGEYYTLVEQVCVSIYKK